MDRRTDTKSRRSEKLWIPSKLGRIIVDTRVCELNLNTRAHFYRVVQKLIARAILATKFLFSKLKIKKQKNFSSCIFKNIKNEYLYF